MLNCEISIFKHKVKWKTSSTDMLVLNDSQNEARTSRKTIDLETNSLQIVNRVLVGVDASLKNGIKSRTNYQNRIS